MRRVQKWQSALAAVVTDRMHRPFSWGTQDCVIFAADCIDAVTDEDLALDMRGTYNTAEQAAALLQTVGGVAHLAASRLGEEVSPRMAQAGDIALVRFEGRDTLAVCVGAHLLAPGANGLVYCALGDALSVWRCTKG